MNVEIFARPMLASRWILTNLVIDLFGHQKSDAILLTC